MFSPSVDWLSDVALMVWLLTGLSVGFGAVFGWVAATAFQSDRQDPVPQARTPMAPSAAWRLPDQE